MLQFSEPPHEDPSPVTYSRVGTPTAGGLLAVPPSHPGGNTNQGSIAFRAMRSVRSLGRRRTPLSSILQAPSPPVKQHSYPIVTIEEATSDGHGDPEDDEVLREEPEQPPSATLVKKARVRPLSEQLLGRSRPRPMHEDDEGEFI